MEFWIGIIILIQAVAAIGVVFGFLHEEVFIDFEKRLADYIKWHKREFVKFLNGAIK